MIIRDIKPKPAHNQRLAQAADGMAIMQYQCGFGDPMKNCQKYCVGAKLFFQPPGEK
jgi:hypothetical protein